MAVLFRAFCICSRVVELCAVEGHRPSKRPTTILDTIRNTLQRGNRRGLCLCCNLGGHRGNQYLPAIVADRTHTVFVHLVMINGSIVAITSAALAELYIRRRAVLDYWLMLICIALIQEQLFFFLGADRWTLGFYAGRTIWLMTSLVVLILLLLEITKLYAFCARSYALIERERDNKLLNAQAITAAIAHEVRQPLTAIIASGGAALEYLKKTPPETEKARLALGKIIKRASYRRRV